MVLLYVFQIFQICDGHFVYPLDDVYIHQSISKNIVDHGVFGITKYQFSAASSSILYSLCLAIIYKFSTFINYTPLLINLISAYFCLFVISKIARNHSFSYTLTNFILLFAVFWGPLATIVIVGMEHGLHIMFILLCLDKAISLLESKSKVTNLDIFLLMIYAIASIASRPETAAILMMLIVLLAFRKKYIIAFLMIISSVIPNLLFGLYSQSHGSKLVANTYIVKANTAQKHNSILSKLFYYFEHIFNQLNVYPQIFLPFTILLVLFYFSNRKKIDFWTYKFLFPIITILTVLIHLTFARVGVFYRYETYLILMILISVFLLLSDLKFDFKSLGFVQKIMIVSVSFLVLTPVWKRAFDAYVDTTRASSDIYCQQMQMSNFIKKYYDSDNVVLNDIGTTSYFTNAHITDLVGLADIEVLNSLGDNFKQNIDMITQNRNSKIALVYEKWYPHQLPESWQKVAELKMDTTITAADNRVSIFTLDSNNKQKLINQLNDFKKSLPKRAKIIIE